MKNAWLTIFVGLLCLGIVGWLFPRLNSSEVRPGRAGRSVTTAAPPSSATTTAAPRATPAPTPLPETLRKAQEYYAAHFARLRQIADVDYPQALARRKADAKHEVAEHFRKEYPKLLEKAHPLHDAIKDADHAFDSVKTKEEAIKVNESIWKVGVASIANFYADTLRDDTSLGEVTVGEMTRELLQSHDGSREVGKALALIEREMLQDEGAAKRVEAIGSGAELADYLLGAQGRYQSAQDKIASDSPLTPEQADAVNRMGQLKTIHKMSEDYEGLHDGGFRAVRQEYLTLQWGLRDLLNHVPEDSPEKRELLTDLADVYARIKQLDDGG